MRNIKPIIKFNGGSPIALCNRCFIIMCYLTCGDNEEDCRILESNGDDSGPYTTVPIGQVPPIYCDRCTKLLTYSINE